MLPVDDNRVEKVIELSKESLDAFCDDISTMFEVDMTCEELENGVVDLKSIKKHFKKIAAIHTVKADGVLNGHFQLVFDQPGLFTLAGVIVMLPPKRIAEEAKRGSMDDAENMGDAVGEVGNLLIGTWDRVFRDEMEGHEHFMKTNTFIGNPWEDPSVITGLSESKEFHCMIYEITVESYSSFKCAAILPVQSLVVAEPQASEDSTEETPASEEAQAEATADAAIESDLVEDSPQEEALASAEATEPEAAEESKTEPDPEPTPAASDPEPVVEAEVEAPAGDTTEQAVNEETSTEDEGVKETVAETPTSKATPAETEALVEQATPSETTEAEQAAAVETFEEGGDPVQVAEPEIVTVSTPPVQPAPDPASAHSPSPTQVLGADLAQLMSMTAQEIMGSEVVWAEQTASVSEVLTSMQQHDVGYVLVGKQGDLQGLVSKSNIMGAMSPYLRPVFSKWRRPADDATMEIMVQWIMSRPVRTVQPTASLAVVIEQMRQFGGRCLPVVDAAGQVHGLITVFDILRVMTPNLETQIMGHTPQAPCLMV